MFRKNTAGQYIHVQGVDSTTGGIKSGVTWTVRRCIDGTFAAATGTATEDGTTGWYKFALSQADTNGNNIAFNFTGTGAIPQTVNIVTTACDPTSTAFGLSIAKTTNITGFNDIAATAVVSSGAITTSGGAVSTVTTTTTATNLTNLPTIPANWLTAAGTAADFTTEIQAGLATQASVDTIDGIVYAILVDTTTDIPAQIAALNNLSSADVTAAVPTATQNADALLNRDMAAVSDTNARSPLNALRFLRNKFSSAAGVLTVTKENDSTTAWTATLTSDAAAEPIVGIDPT